MKKGYWILVMLFIALVACKQEKEYYVFSTFREPATDGLFLAYSEDGYHWNDLGGPYLAPEVGTQKVMRDPSIVQGPDGTFHFVWTSSWRDDLGIGYASSKDLINWSEQKHILLMDHDTSTVNVWAPELFYDDEKEEYIIVWASTVPYKFEKGIEDERNNHRQYYVTTKDFKTFSETKLFLDPGFSAIDGTIVKCAPNDYVLVFKDNTRPMRNIKVAFADFPVGPFHDISGPFTKFKTEGPTVAKVGDQYLIYFDSYGDYEYGAVSTTDFETFKNISDQVSLPEGHKHGTIFKVKQQIIDQLLANQPNLKKE